MTQAQIRKEKKALDAKLKKLEGQKTIVRAKLQVLASQCEHPNKYGYTACGENGTRCPDCGWDI